MLKLAIEKANRLMGGWPDEDAIIAMLEGLGFDARRATSTSGPTITRATRTRSPGSGKNNPDYPFRSWDPKRVITVPIRNITAPPNWPKPDRHNESTAAADWIKKTWPKAMG